MATATKPRLTVQRPRNDAYVGLLTISLLALITSCVLLYLDYSQYGTQKPTSVPKAPNPTPGVSIPDAQPAEKPETPAGDAPKAEAPKPETPTTPPPMEGGSTPEPKKPSSMDGIPTGRAKAKPGASGTGGGGTAPPTKPGDPSK
jgi:hypothetical protein